VEEWEAFFTRAFKDIYFKTSPDGPGVRKVAFRLMWTDPHRLFDSYMWHEQCLRDRNDTQAWTAIYKMFGAKWKTKSNYNSFQRKILRPQTPILKSPPTATIDSRQLIPPTTSKTSNIKRRSSSNTPGTLALPTRERPVRTVNFQQNTCFLSKPLGNEKATTLRGVNTRLKRKYETFIKIRLPKVTSELMTENEKEATSKFLDLMLCLWKLDPDLLVWPWDQEKVRPPLVKKIRQTSQKQSLE
jgi:hypothetical protein